MGDPKSFPPSFSFSKFPTSSSFSTSSFSPECENLTFSAGEKSKLRRPAHRRRSSTSSVRNSTASSSSSSFEIPSVFSNANEKKNFEDRDHMWHWVGVPESAKTKFNVLSAITGTIPCHFEGSSYFSQTREASGFANGTEEAIKKEKDESLCVQNSPMSQIIVSRLMKGIPQSPHYWPLRGYSEAAKQSLIIAWDQIFEETVDQIQSLQLNGFCTDAKRLRETTQDLQTMGYYVVPLRRRLVELSDILQRRKSHMIEMMKLKHRATQHMVEKKRMEFEIVKLKAKIEAEKASFEDVMGKVAKMDDEMPSFNVSFSKLAIKPL